MSSFYYLSPANNNDNDNNDNDNKNNHTSGDGLSPPVFLAARPRINNRFLGPCLPNAPPAGLEREYTADVLHCQAEEHPGFTDVLADILQGEQDVNLQLACTHITQPNPSSLINSSPSPS